MFDEETGGGDVVSVHDHALIADVRAPARIVAKDAIVAVEALDAVVGSPEEIPAEVNRRYGDICSRISFYAPYKSDAERWRPVFEELKS